VTASALCLTPTVIWAWSSVMGGCASYSSVNGSGGSLVSQKKQQSVGCGCLAFVMLIIIGAIGDACSSSGTSTSQRVAPTPTAAVSSPSFGAAAAPSPAHTRRHRNHRHRYVPPSMTAPASRSTCYPLTNSGKCYEPGEFCRRSDHGTGGVAGNGDKIRCEDNNGWRWEPV
jgi:hypothetical protein